MGRKGQQTAIDSLLTLAYTVQVWHVQCTAHFVGANQRNKTKIGTFARRMIFKRRDELSVIIGIPKYAELAAKQRFLGERFSGNVVRLASRHITSRGVH